MDAMPPRRRLGVAVLLSCSIYALPLIGPHAAVPVGEALVHGATRGDRSAAWTAAEVAAALTMQLGAGAIWYWVLGRLLSLRLLALVAAVPAFFAFAEWYYLFALPTRFLIEHDVRSEQSSWSAACTLPNESLTVVGYKPAIVRGGDAVLVSDSTTRLARVTLARSADGVT